MAENKQNKSPLQTFEWDAFQKEVGEKLKHYHLIKVSRKQLRTIKSMWRQGYKVSDVISYVLLDSTKVKYL